MAMKKMQKSDKTGTQLKKEGAAMKAKGQAMKAAGIKQKELGTSIKNYPGQSAVDKALFGEVIVRKGSTFKTGGMVNSNTKVSASKVAKGRPAKSAEPKSASKVATGRVGGTSKAPRAAAPKMKMGGSMKKKSC